MPSAVDICNMALSRIGISQRIGNLDTEKSNEANQCRLWYDQSRKTVLQAVDWNRARRRNVPLALIEAAPNSIWGYSYAYPNNCLAIRYLVPPGMRFPRKDQKIPYEVANDGERIVIYTNLELAEATFTHDLVDPSLFDAIMVSALAYLIASEVALPLSVKSEMAKQARDGYGFMLNQGAAANANEGELGPEPTSEYESFRNGG